MKHVSHPELVIFNYILPCNDIGDHDGPYTFLDVRMPRYEPRFQMIRDERSLNSRAFIEDVNRIPFNLVCAVSDPNGKLSIFNSLLLEVIDRHAPTKELKLLDHQYHG